MFKSVLVAIDGSDHARKALRIAVDLAEHYKAKLNVLHVVTDRQVSAELRHMAEVEQLIKPVKEALPESGNVPGEMSRFFSDAALYDKITQVATAVGQRILDEAIATARASTKIETHAILEHGDPANIILECADRVRADLLVLGSRGLSNIEGVFRGSVSTKASHAAQCTCLTVK